jgi:catechol 2,3-dioxygenase-like lactoylglutathione lyase family enzyme
MESSKHLKGNFRGMQHIGIPVTNLTVSVDFYSSLGFKRILASSVPVPEENDAILVAMMEQNGVIIELYQVTRKEIQNLRKRKDGPVDHIAFDMKDVEKAFYELKNAGFTLIEEKPVFLDFWEKGCKYFAIRGPDGEKLEFNEIII